MNLVLNLTAEQRRELEKTLAAAEPYPDDAEELSVLDGVMKPDHAARWNATMAKRFLEQDDREKRAMQGISEMDAVVSAARANGQTPCPKCKEGSIRPIGAKQTAHWFVCDRCKYKIVEE